MALDWTAAYAIAGGGVIGSYGEMSRDKKRGEGVKGRKRKQHF